MEDFGAGKTTDAQNFLSCCGNLEDNVVGMADNGGMAYEISE